MEEDTFESLLAKLADQHRREIKKGLGPLQEENRQLKSVVDKLEAELHQEQEKSLTMIQCRHPNIADGVVSEGNHDTSEPRLLSVVASPAATDAQSLALPHAVVSPSILENPSTRRPEGSETKCLRPSLVTGSSSAKGRTERTEKVIAEMNMQVRKRQRERLRALMELSNSETLVTSHHIMTALSKKAPSTVTARWNEERLKVLIMELLALHAQPPLTVETQYDQAIHLQVFVNMMLLPDLSSRIGETCTGVHEVQEHLLKEDVHDVMLKINRSHTRSTGTVIQDDDEPKHVELPILNFIVGCAVILSLLALGLSLDYWQDSVGWIIIEASIAVVFITEIVMKTFMMGWKEFLTGPASHFNILDTIITALAIVDIVISFITLSYSFGTDVSASRVAMVARVLRLARITRLAKIVDMPILRQLANMLSGFVIAVPTLFWILVLMFLWLYLVGILYRTVVGPTKGQDLLSICPAADYVTSRDPTECKTHFLYGEEFFNTVPNSMYTVFRCVIGDCTSAAGKSLAAHFAKGYGSRFIVSYYLGMILVIFGLFNVINAIFVESVITGLKNHTSRRKFQQLYDARYVQENIQKLRKRLDRLSDEADSCCPDGPIGKRTSFSEGTHISELCFTEEDYVKIVRDEVCSNIFDDLDVTKFNREGLFDIFDVGGNGRISIAEFMNTLMMLRGEPQKSDVVSAFVLIKNLRERMKQWELSSLDNQLHMLRNQNKLLVAFDAKRGSVNLECA